MTICTTPFEQLARVNASGQRLPDLPLLIIDHPLATMTRAEIDALARNRVGEVLAMLTSARTSL